MISMGLNANLGALTKGVDCVRIMVLTQPGIIRCHLATDSHSHSPDANMNVKSSRDDYCTGTADRSA